VSIFTGKGICAEAAIASDRPNTESNDFFILLNLRFADKSQFILLSKPFLHLNKLKS
jgi:hypothetical protein